MSFNSPSFLVFLPLVVLGTMLLRRQASARDVWLLIASYFFYMSWNWKYAGLIALSTLVDYAVGWGLLYATTTSKRRLLLALSVVVNLGMLAIYKYFNFFMDVSERTLSLFGGEFDLGRLNVLLPVGISFYTFQTMSYTIDLYQRKIDHERNFIKFALFVSFFPQLVAGPIVRAAEFLPQLQREPRTDPDEFASGLTLVFQGLFKKIVLADLLATMAVDEVFSNPSAFSTLDLYAALVGYAFQIYNDFSGYSDIAIGAGRMLGFQLPENFNRPYVSQDVREFWSRWHISLSTWLRDYLYIPLGGNRGGPTRTKINLLITMLLGGLWHGAAINFVLWGAFHGVLLVITHAMGRDRHLLPYAWMRRVACFHLILFSWLLFRIGDMDTFASYAQSFATMTWSTQLSPVFFALIALAMAIHFTPAALPQRLCAFVQRVPSPIQGGIYATLLLIYWGASLDAPTFIYFQF